MSRSTDSASAADYIPETQSLRTLARTAEFCEGCDLFRHATQVVFGEGTRKARLVLVGEQPGDQEDRQGKPFVGPAGKLLYKCLNEAEVPTDSLYVTNAVKHFKFVMTGKRRLHQKPSAREVRACHPWLQRELEIVQPEVLVLLGAIAARSVLGTEVRVTKDHGKWMVSAWCANTMVTVHPSAVLRNPRADLRDEMKLLLLSDLRTVARRLLKSA